MSDDPEREPGMSKSVPVVQGPRAFRASQTLWALLRNKSKCAEITEDHVLSVLASRRAREAAFGRELFADPAWDILLELYAASLGGRRMTRADLAKSLDIPEPSLARWAKALAERGLVVATVDPGRGSVMWVELRKTGAATMKRLMDYWGSAFLTI